jgi:MFS family permease
MAFPGRRGVFTKDLHLNSAAQGLAGGIFFIGYMVFQIPGGHLAERVAGSALGSGARDLIDGVSTFGQELVAPVALWCVVCVV